MFGGLELKGGSVSRKEDVASANNQDGVSGPSSTSGFSFLATPSTAVSTTSTSAFSFLSASSAAMPSDSTNKTATAPPFSSATTNNTASGFSFLSAVNPPTTEDISMHSTSSDDNAAPLSSFGFITAIPALATSSTLSVENKDATNSAFSFLSGPPPATSAQPAAASTYDTLIPSSTIATTTDLLGTASTITTNDTSTVVPNPAPVQHSAGAGTTFASAVAPGIKKRRTRTTAIGLGAQPPSTTTAASSPHSNNAAPTATSPTSSSTREEAVKASQRAENFMNQKILEQQKTQWSSEASNKLPPENTTSNTSSLKFSHNKPPTARTTSKALRPQDNEDDTVDMREDRNHDVNDDDDIIAKAKAAAEEAQKMEEQNHLNKPRSWTVTGLFRSAGSRTTQARKPSISNNTSSHSASNSGTITPPLTVNSNNNNLDEETPAERLQREQEQVQLNIMEQQKFRMQMLEKEEDETTKESLYQPVEISSKPLTENEHDANDRPVSFPSQTFTPKVSTPAAAKSALSSSFNFLTTTTNNAVVPVETKKSTPRGEFDAMMESFRNKVHFHIDQVHQLRKHKTGLLEEQVQVVALLRSARSKKEQAEAQQIAAVEAEDFDLADRMNTIMEQVEKERLENVRFLDNIRSALSQLHEQRQRLVTNVLACFVEVQENLQVFLKRQRDQASTSGGPSSILPAMEQFEKVSKQISAEHERLQLDLKNLERDTTLVQQERHELETAITEQAGEFERLRDKAREQVKVVEQEMEDLRQLLAAKQAQVAALRTEAAGHDEAVLKVRLKFSRQLARVQNKELSLQDNREEWEAEQMAWTKQKEAHEAVVAQHHQALLERDSLLDELNKQLEMANTFQNVVAKEIAFDFGDERSKSTPSDGSDHDLVQETLVNCQAAVSEAKDFLQAAEGRLQALKDENAQILARLPELEEVKKSAAANRDFKTAGKASKELKEYQHRLDDLEKVEMVQAQERYEAAVASLADKERKLAEEQSKADEQERGVAIVRMETIAQNMSRLKATTDKMCPDDKNGTASIQGVGSYVLQAQMEVLRAEGEALGEKYGRWNEFLQQFGLLESSKVSSSDPNKAAEGLPSEIRKEADAEKGDEEATAMPSSAQETTMAKAEAMKRFRQLTAQLEETNMAIEAAAVEEDFEKAATLEEVLQDLLLQVQSLSLTDDEMALALVNVQSEEEQKQSMITSTEEKVDHRQADTPLDGEAQNISCVDDQEKASAKETQPSEDKQVDHQIKGVVQTDDTGESKQDEKKEAGNDGVDSEKKQSHYMERVGEEEL